MPSYCPSCGEIGYSFSGNKKAKYLLVFTKPYIVPAVRGYKDKVSGLDVLRREMSRCGLDLQHDFELSWLWLHDASKNIECYNAGRDLILDSAKGKQAVILVGSEASEEFCGYGAGDVAGLQVESAVLSAPLVFVLPKPEGVFVRGAGIGELRLAVQKLGKLLND